MLVKMRKMMKMKIMVIRIRNLKLRKKYPSVNVQVCITFKVGYEVVT